MTVNAPPGEAHIFAWKHHDSLRPLTRRALDDRLALVSRQGKLHLPQGHGCRIRGTLEYLLRGVPFDAMKAKGRWAGDSFLLYLRKHAEIMAPYMQDMPSVQSAFTRYAIPPVS